MVRAERLGRGFRFPRTAERGLRLAAFRRRRAMGAAGVSFEGLRLSPWSSSESSATLLWGSSSSSVRSGAMGGSPEGWRAARTIFVGFAVRDEKA